MSRFQIISRTAQVPAPSPQKGKRLGEGWSAAITIFIGMSISGGLFGLTVNFVRFSAAIFLLLPVFVSVGVTLALLYSRKRLLMLNPLTFLPLFGGVGITVALFNSRKRLFTFTPLYLLCTISLAFAYCLLVIGIDLLIHIGQIIHPDPKLSLLSFSMIVGATILAWAIILEPGHAYLQARIEQRFNKLNRETSKALEDFTATLREEISLTQLRERFLTIVEQSMKPYTVSFWVRASQEEQMEVSGLEEVEVAEDDPLVAYLLQHPGVTELERLQLDAPLLQEMRARSAAILLPLASQGELIGVLMLGLHLDGVGYTREERNVLTSLAAQVAPALRVAQMVREQQRQVRENERIEQELRTAQAIQQTFLPKEVPALPGWQFAPYYQPAREVGGDFYDFVPLADGRLGLVIGDVTGKGIPAALVMATVHTMLRAAAQGSTSPGEVLAKVNELLVAEIPAGMFVTCFYALLDPRSGRLCYANAGHEAPYRRCNGSAIELPATGMPLGMLPGTRYEEHEATLAPGESLFFYSDGLVEAHNARREMFGFPRLQTLLAQGVGETPLIDFMLGELQSFTGQPWEQEDDVTLLALQRVASGF